MTLKNYLILSKFRIVFLVLITTALGYFLSEPRSFSYEHFLFLMFGVYFISSASFILNQAQETELDSQMERTKNRPIVQGKLSKKQAYLISFFLMGLGSLIVYQAGTEPLLFSLITVLLYNFFYTLKWKKNYPFGSVFFGAIPGALPVVIGFSSNPESVLSLKCFYLFLIMFLWQMPHFWFLALRYRKDYKKGGVRVLPAYKGEDQTLFHIGLYVFSYLGLALLSPFFLETGWVYFMIAFPFCLKTLLEFYFFYKEKTGFGFFSWLNISLVVFLSAPLLDWWAFSVFFKV